MTQPTEGAAPPVALVRRRTRLVWLLTAALAAAALVLDLRLVGTGRATQSFSLRWWLVLPCFALTEYYVIHFEFHRQVRFVSLCHLPLVLALYFTSPLALVLVRVAGALPILVFVRRQRPVKLAFNVASFWLEAGVAISVFRWLLPSGGAVGWSSWPAAFAATLAAEVASFAAVAAVISLSEGRSAWRQLGKPFLFAFVVVVQTSVALLGVTGLGYDPRTGFALVLLALITIVAFHAHGRLTERHDRLKELYNFARSLGPLLPDVHQLGVTLTTVRDMLKAERVELALLGAGDGTGTLIAVEEDSAPTTSIVADLGGLGDFERQVLQSGQPRLLGRRQPPPWARHRALPVEDRMAVPVGNIEHQVGVLRAAHRSGDVRGFDAADLRLLETVADQLSAALEKGRLLDGLHRAATRDALTGLANLESARTALDGLLCDHGGAVVLVLDLDRFQDINDTLGHDVGDELLREVARRLEGAAPMGATAARLGGDQFALVLPGGTSPEIARLAALGARARVEGPAGVGALTADVRATIGLARAPAHGGDAGTLLRRAEMAMFAAKDVGAAVLEWEPGHERDGARRLVVVAALREALSQDALTVAFQPKIALGGAQDGDVVGLEALARWQHPELGAVPPDEFIGLAETSGLIGALTSTILRQALRACRGWHDRGLPVSVSVNVSARSLVDPLLVGSVAEALRAAGLEPQWLTLELTESSVMENAGRCVEVLRQLRALGVRLSIDDFGTGYSSLTYVKGLPVHEVKIDKAFVNGITDDVADRAVVRAVVELAHSLGLAVVAEGVEDAHQARVLTALSVDEAQGYLYARPMPAEAAGRWLGEHNVLGGAATG